MKSLLSKELKLAASPLSYLFLAFSAMTFIPGYPILVGAFFICFGIFQSFQAGREQNDILYTVLLPVAKGAAVRAKYIFTVFIQVIALALMAAFTALRMTLLGDAAPYAANPMMNANPVYLAWSALMFALFNGVFLGMFFQTAYKFAKPFVTYIVGGFVLIIVAETLHHIPGLTFLNTGERLPLQCLLLLLALGIYAAVTVLSCRRAAARFEALDL